MATKSFVLNQESLAFSQQAKVSLDFIVASGVVSLMHRAGYEPRLIVEKGLAGSQVLMTQALVDTLLGSTNEVLVGTAFGTTAMVADDTACMVIDFEGQISHVVSSYVCGFCPTAIHLTSYGTAATFDSDAALTDADIDGLQVYVTSAGNLAVVINFTNLTAAATSGHFSLNLNLALK